MKYFSNYANIKSGIPKVKVIFSNWKTVYNARSFHKHNLKPTWLNELNVCFTYLKLLEIVFC